MMKHRVEPTGEYRTSKTVVWWDMDGCLLPIGYDPSLVGPRIDTELKNLGYNGPLTIIAYGDLQGIPFDVLRALSSGGIVLKHIPSGETLNMLYDFGTWLDQNGQNPVTVLFIADGEVLEEIACELGKRDRDSYNFLIAYPSNNGLLYPLHASINLCGEWFWDIFGLLRVSGAEETTRLERGSEMFSCESCDYLSDYFSCHSLEDFIKHLDSAEHAQNIQSENQDREEQFFAIAELAAKARKASVDALYPPESTKKLPKKRKSKEKKTAQD